MGTACTPPFLTAIIEHMHSVACILLNTFKSECIGLVCMQMGKVNRLTVNKCSVWGRGWKSVYGEGGREEIGCKNIYSIVYANVTR